MAYRAGYAVLMHGRVGMALAFALAAAPLAAQAQEVPRRVVSLNLCTDHLALLLAEPGQVASVSYLAADPVSSSVTDLVGDIPLNHGLAEEVALMAPDLVVAGQYGAQQTVRMLESLGYRVAKFAPESNFDDIRSNLREMARLLGQEARAEALIAEMDARLVEIATLPPSGKVAALYYSGGFTEGTSSLGHAILTAAGIDNLAAKLGMNYGGTMAIETILLHQPDIILRGQSFAGYSRAEAMLNHPALLAYIAESGVTMTTSAAWVCGTPQIVDEVARLATLAREARP